MSRDNHGQAHTGNIGLFDDQGEWEETQRRLQKRADRELAKELEWREKQQRNAKGTPRPHTGFFRKIAQYLGFTLRKEQPSDPKPEGVDKKRTTSSEKKFEEDTWSNCADTGKSDSSDTLVEEQLLYIPAPIPDPTTQPTYPESWIHPEPSIFIEECGCVRVKSEKPGDGGWTIVPRSAILWGQ